MSGEIYIGDPLVCLGWRKMTKIEYVAKAIFEADQNDLANEGCGTVKVLLTEDIAGPRRLATWDDLSAGHKERLMLQARAAIGAMRLTPLSDDEVFSEAQYRNLRAIYGSFFSAYDLLMCFNYLIESALSEEKTP
jgi:hypothetical protein